MIRNELFNCLSDDQDDNVKLHKAEIYLTVVIVLEYEVGNMHKVKEVILKDFIKDGTESAN